jgi:hypothetical protein
MVNLALLYLNGQGVPKDETKGFDLLHQAAEAGAPDAQVQMGMDYNAGVHGLMRNQSQAIIWFRKAAEQGDQRAQDMLARLHAGKPDLSQDSVQEAEKYRKDAEQGNAEAQYRLGVCYSIGKGVQQSDEQAIYWYQLAVKQNHLEAMLDLGLLYLNGRGVPPDADKAFELFRRSANLGEPDAQYRVGYAYDIGEGVQKDQKEAINWYRKSADQGFAGAQFNLAMRIYSNNKAEAYYWLSLAAPQLNGEPLATTNKLRDGAAAMLKPSERAEIDERVKQWQEAHPKKP